jgi:hypothetical protein
MRFRRLSLAAVAVALAGTSITAAAQRLLADFSGGWDVMVQGPQGPMASTLTLTQKGDSVSGKFDSEVGSAMVKGTAKGDSLMVSLGLDVGGQVINLTTLGVLKDKDNMEGKIIAEGMGEFPFAASRQKGN